MSSYKKEFQVLSVQDNTKKKMEDEIVKRYSAFAKDTEPDSKVTMLIHSDRKIELNPGDILEVNFIKNQTTLVNGDEPEKGDEQEDEAPSE